MNEHLRVQWSQSGRNWFEDEDAASLAEAMRIILRRRDDGPGDRVLDGYRVLDDQGRVVLVLAPIGHRLVKVSVAFTGEHPESSTV